MRWAGLLFDQLGNAFSADEMARSASEGVADAAAQHGDEVEGLMMSKVEEPGSCLPLIHMGIDRVRSFFSDRKVMLTIIPCVSLIIEEVGLLSARIVDDGT
jgi:hypothetical protein